MAINLGEANKKLNKSEYVLFLSTEPRNIVRLSPKQIETRINRITKMLEKLKAEKLKRSGLRRLLGLRGKQEIQSLLKKRYFAEGLKRLKKEQKRRNTRREALKNRLIAEERKNQIYRKMNQGTERKVNVTHAIHDQNIKVNAKQRSFLNSETKRKLGHARSRNQKVQAKRDSH